MSNKDRLGKNPLFRDALSSSPAAAPEENVKVYSKQDLQSKLSLPNKTDKPSKPSSKAGLQEGWTRGTFIMRETTLETIRNYAYWERRDIKDVVEEVFRSFFKGRDVQPRPGKQ
jgi:hypothetical protein